MSLPLRIIAEGPTPVFVTVYQYAQPPLQIPMSSNPSFGQFIVDLPNTGLQSLQFSVPVQLVIRYIGEYYKTIQNLNCDPELNMFFGPDLLCDALEIRFSPLYYGMGPAYRDLYIDERGDVEDSGFFFVNNPGYPPNVPPYAISGFPQVY